MGVGLTLLVLTAGIASLAAAVVGWRALMRDPQLRSRTQYRDLPRPGRAVALLACAAGAVGGIWLASKVQEGKQEHFEQRRR